MKKNKTQLSKRETNAFLKKYIDWTANPSATKISATFTFNTHVEALVFIARATVFAEVAQHHPDIVFSYKKVKVILTTHEEKTITKKDIALAKRISDLQKPETKGG